jgi:hypothetical protein
VSGYKKYGPRSADETQKPARKEKPNRHFDILGNFWIYCKEGSGRHIH